MHAFCMFYLYVSLGLSYQIEQERVLRPLKSGQDFIESFQKYNLPGSTALKQDSNIKYRPSENESHAKNIEFFRHRL